MSDSIGIFISHKSEDESIARQVRDLLAGGSGRINGFISSEIEPGKEWFKAIKESILESKILLLLLVKPRMDWDWPLLEAGLAVDLHDDNLRSVVCLHHPRIAPPAPLTNWQTVPATNEQLTRFLELLYGSKDYIGLGEPLNAALAKNSDLLGRLAKEIGSLFSSEEIVPWFPHLRMVLSFEDTERPGEVEEQLLDELSQTGRIPPTARIKKASDALMRQVFGLGEGNYCWEQIRSRSEQLRHTEWLKEVGAAALAATKREIDIHIRGTIRSLRGDVIYRPVLYRTELVGDKPLEFHLFFTEEPRPSNIAGPGKLGQLYRMLSLAHRFRSEVIARFNGNLGDAALGSDLADSGIDVPDECQRLIEVVGLIEKEAEDMGILDPDKLIEPFDDEDVQQELMQLLTEWNAEIKQPMEQAAETADTSKLSILLERLDDTNKRFISICGTRYAELARNGVSGQDTLTSPKRRPPEADYIQPTGHGVEGSLNRPSTTTSNGATTEQS